MSNSINTDLPIEAQNVWLAYQAMSESKKTYFSLLQELDMKYKKRGSPTLAENQRLEELLKLHNENVAEFSNAMNAVEDKETRDALLQKMGAVHNASGTH